MVYAVAMMAATIQDGIASGNEGPSRPKFDCLIPVQVKFMTTDFDT